MKKQTSRTLAFALLFAAIFAVPNTKEASADLLDYRLIGGVSARQYWIDPNLINPDYAGPIRDAVASWNALGTRVSFAETGDGTSSEADFYALDYGNQQWRGVAVMRDANGNGVVACVSCYPYADWAYAELSLNDWHLRNDCCFTKWQNTAAHEFGHAVGIDHTDLDSALMYGSDANYDLYGVYTPQGDDAYWASQLQ